MRENDGNLTATNRPPLNANSTYYTLTKNRSEVSTPENNSHTDEFGKGTRIALVNPIFTSQECSYSSFTFLLKSPFLDKFITACIIHLQQIL
jgi:hypothetical protein